MTVDETLVPVAEQLAACPEWHVWVIEYGVTHHRMVIALHPGTYPRTAKVELLDCAYLAGNLQAGPYVLVLDQTDYHGERLWEIRSTDASFRVIFGSARLLSSLT